MSFLSKVRRGRIKRPVIVMAHALDGVGKSTLASGAPGVIFVGPENGTDQLDVARMPTALTWEDLTGQLNEIERDPHDHKSLAIDTLDWIEMLLHQSIMKKYSAASMPSAAGGFGKAFDEAYAEMVKLKDQLARIRDKRNMNIILLAHSAALQFNDPTTEAAYMRYELKLYESKNGTNSVRALFREFVDILLFLNYVTYSKGEGKNARGVSERVRKMWTERDPAFDAKNRFGLPFEMDFPLGSAWENLMQAIENSGPAKADSLKRQIETLLSECKDTELAKKVRDTLARAGDNHISLAKIKEKLEKAMQLSPGNAAETPAEKEVSA